LKKVLTDRQTVAYTISSAGCKQQAERLKNWNF